MPKRPRTARRAAAREHEEMVRDLERLAALAPGGSAERAREIESPAQVDVIATATRCPVCDGPLLLEEHAAAPGGRRTAHVRCTACGRRRALHFRLAPPRLQ